MKGKVSPIFSLFSRQFDEGKDAFLNLGRQYKGKKAIELEQKLIFIEIFIELLGRVHFETPNLKFELFGPFKDLFRGLKKTKHIKYIQAQLDFVKAKNDLTYNSYEKYLLDEKKKLYNEIYELIVGTSLETWRQLYDQVRKNCVDLKPLMINTATTQIINEELEYFNLDNKSKLDFKALKDIYEGLRVIIAMENIRIESGFNPIFIDEVHQKMAELQQSLLFWYQNHLLMQHLIYYFGDKEEISKKYRDLHSFLKSNKKSLTSKVESQCKFLFDRILD